MAKVIADSSYEVNQHWLIYCHIQCYSRGLMSFVAFKFSVGQYVMNKVYSSSWNNRVFIKTWNVCLHQRFLTRMSRPYTWVVDKQVKNSGVHHFGTPDPWEISVSVANIRCVAGVMDISNDR